MDLSLDFMKRSKKSIGANVDLKKFRKTMKQYIGGARENERNFYHPDHLGSGSWITDVSGKPVQHLQYLPYGDPYINQRLSGYNERFSFTGKERDSETGYGYFGARYMDHELTTGWLSVDPKSDKYPSMSPYAYCAWNPIKLVDPDGKEINPVYGLDGSYRGCTKEGYTGEIIIYAGDDDFNSLTADELIQTTNNCQEKAAYYSHDNHDKLSVRAKEKMYKHILSTADGVDVGGSTFCVDDMELRYNASGSGNWNTQMNLGGESQFILTATDKYLPWEEHGTISYIQHGSYEATVENIISSVVYHEWNGHFINKYSGADHIKCYEASKSSPYFPKTTDRYQNYINHMINK